MDHDETDPMLKKFADEGWSYRQCNLNPANWFWSPRNGNRTAPATKKSKVYKDLLATSDAEGSEADFVDS